jgi:glycerol-3-phosphate dehydrogenase (NAD(P)+)
MARATQVVVLGGGSWGTTVASIVAQNVPTTLWAREIDTVADVNTHHRNSAYLPDLELTSTLRATTDLAEAVAGADLLVVAIPSKAFRGVLETVAEHLRPWVPVVSLVKGIERSTHKRMTQIIEELLPGNPAGVLSGPNIAREVANGYAAAATLAMPNHHTALMIQPILRTTLFRVYTSTDVVGAEIAGALKNVYALAVGFGDGLEAGDNTRAMVITRSLRELTRLGMAMGGQEATFAGLAGMGDLIATCTSPLSRNRYVGFELAKGRSVDEIVGGMKQVAEGVTTSSVVMELGARYGVDLPIAAEVDAVINHGQPVEGAYRGLLRQAPGHEVHGTEW